MNIQLFQVDAFSDRLFGGNPAAVCPLDSWLDDHTMQHIAAENNLSETAFVVPEKNGYRLRWFTPTTEVELCGHATLATSHVLFQHLNVQQEHIVFHTRSGQLIVTREEDLYAMDFPATPPKAVETPPKLVDALGKEPERVLKSRDYMAVYEHEDEIARIKPKFSCLATLDSHLVIVTARGNVADFVSRCFAPAVGVNEDPVTGSAHTTLVPYWAERLGKDSLYAEQISKRRGELYCQHLGNRIKIKGRAITYMTGVIELD